MTLDAAGPMPSAWVRTSASDSPYVAVMCSPSEYTSRLSIAAGHVFVVQNHGMTSTKVAPAFAAADCSAACFCLFTA